MLYTLKEALNLGLVFKKVPRLIKFNQEATLKHYINMNTELRKNKAVFGKTLENERKHRHINRIKKE